VHLDARMSASIANEKGRQKTLEREGCHADADDSRIDATQCVSTVAE
jgi:hypothetical protein